jgi:hypothetical protein
MLRLILRTELTFYYPQRQWKDIRYQYIQKAEEDEDEE